MSIYRFEYLSKAPWNIHSGRIVMVW